MKKVTLLSIVLILLAVSVAPVLAAGPNNGQGNGGNAGQGNSAGNQDQTRLQDKDQQRNRDRDRINTPGSGGNGTQEHTRMRTPFYLQGTISGISDTTVTVTLIHGNAQVKQYIGKTLVLTTNDATLYYMITPNEEPHADRVRIEFMDLVIGQVVAIHGNLVDTLYTARLITVYNRTTLGQAVTEKP